MCVRMNSVHVVVVLRSGAGGGAMALQDVAHGLVTHGVAQVRQGSDDAVITPRAIVLSHADDQRLQLWVNRGTPWGFAVFGAITLLGHERAVPAENGVGLDDLG